MTAALRSPFNLSAHLRPTVGDQKISFTSVDHMGWMLCDGRTLSTTDYGLLFGVIGWTFGTDLSGTSSFRLPDFRGCVPGMAGRPSFSNAANPNTYARGDRTGEQQHTLSVAEMPTHNHGTQTATAQPSTNYELTSTNGTHDHTGQTTGLLGGSFIVNATENVYNSLTPLNAVVNAGEGTHDHEIDPDGEHTHTLQSQGGSQPHNNMQPTLFAGNMFIYSGKNMQAYFPYTWVGHQPDSNATAPTPGNVLIF